MPVLQYFCVDAGASHSRGRIYDATGQVLAEAEAGAANASYDREQAVASVDELWRRLCAVFVRDPGHVSDTAFSIGGAGLYLPKFREAFVACLPPFEPIVTMSDGYAALIGAGAGQPSALITVGTGVAGHRLFEDGTSIQRDGLGWVVGDRGSGSWMGGRALRHAMEVWDRVAPPSALSQAVLQRLGGSKGLLEGALSNLNAKRLAAFAPLVLETSTGGCPVARGIFSAAVEHLADLVRALACDSVPLYLNGGLAATFEPALAGRIGRSFAQASGDAMEGCLLVSQGKAPAEQVVFADP